MRRTDSISNDRNSSKRPESISAADPVGVDGARMATPMPKAARTAGAAEADEVKMAKPTPRAGEIKTVDEATGPSSPKNSKNKCKCSSRASQELTQNAEAAVAKILDKAQVARVRQIQLQLRGPDALTRPDMIEKLNMTDEQVEQIRELSNEQRQANRAVQKSQGEFFRKMMPPPADGGQNAANGQNGNRRGGRGGGFDPEAMKKAMEDPANQKQMEEFREERSKIESQFSATVYNKVLYPRQRTTYKKMLGAPFDQSKMRGGGGGGAGWFIPGGRNGAVAKKNGTPGTASTSAKSDGDESTSTPAPATAKPKRPSLRDLRGSSSGTQDE